MLCMQISYCVFKLFPKECKVVYISRQSDDIPLDFCLLYKKIEQIDHRIKQVVLTKKIDRGIIGKLKYVGHMFTQMYHISTSKAVVLDGYCITASVLKHKVGTNIIQLWHALGAIKCFGYQTLDRPEGRISDLAKSMKMHANYNYVICASRETAKVFSEAFNTPEDNFRILGMPRVDYITGEPDKNQSILEKHPEYKGKKTILYIPTFRKNSTLVLQDLIGSVDVEKYNLLIKPHPLDRTIIEQQFSIEEEYSTYDLMKFADYIITDYSATAIEASLLDKPILFYLYDYDQYVDDRGLNIDPFKEMPKATSCDVRDLINIIEKNQYDYNELQDFRNKYVETAGFSNTEKIAELIVSLVNDR